MSQPAPHYAHSPRVWVGGILAIFTVFGLGFGSWLSRLPATRDHLGASTFEMSLIGLGIAAGSVIGLLISGRTVTWLGPRRTLTVGAIVQAVAMPLATILFWTEATIPGVVCLFVYGFAFSTSDVAMNVSGAAAERALGRPRMPALHAGFSLGSVSAMGIGALAEKFGVPVPVHVSIIFALVLIVALVAVRLVPHDEHAALRASQTATAASAVTGSIPVIPPNASVDPAPSRSPWRDPRILLIGLITLSMSLAEGVAADWMPLALVDGRGIANATGTLVLGVFFVCMTATRFAGAALLTRFGRVPVLRGGALLCTIGVLIVILVPAVWASVIGAALWGIGCALGFPVGMSAAADRPATAVRDVATVSAIAYTAFLLGPMMIGFLGEHFGLLQAFWPLAAIVLLSGLVAAAAREPGTAKR